LVYTASHLIISPFLLGGVGLYYTQIEGPNNFSNTTNRFGVHAGAGFEVMLNDAFSLDGSYRYIWVEKFISEDLSAMNKEYEDSGYMVTIGVNFLFQ
jgi:opacity protein-like surface antigen